MTFAVDLQKFAEKAKGNASLVTRKVVFDIGTALVMRSPVGDAKYWKSPPPPGYVGGRFRANWQYGEGAADTKTTEDIDPAGNSTIDRLTQKVAIDAAGKVHYLTNSLPYAQALEDGHSRQAPLGLVGITALEFNLFINKAVAGLK